MADVKCGLCGFGVDENDKVCPNCWENPRQAAKEREEQPEQRPRVTVVVATARVALEQGEKILLGREGDPRFVRALETFDNVGRQHVEITAGDGVVTALARETKNGTFIGDRKLRPGEELNVQLPATIRMAKNCFVHFQVTDE